MLANSKIAEQSRAEQAASGLKPEAPNEIRLNVNMIRNCRKVYRCFVAVCTAPGFHRILQIWTWMHQKMVWNVNLSLLIRYDSL